MTFLAPLCVVTSLLVLTTPSTGHNVGIGKCPIVKGMANFDVTKFYGKWYINEVYSAINTCMTMDYQPKPNSNIELEVSQGRELIGLSASNVAHTTNYVGTATMDTTTPSEMTIKWPVSTLFGDMSHLIVDTDYTTYALTFECQTIFTWFGSRYSASILSRTPNLDATTVQKIKETATAAGIKEIDDFKQVSHLTCTPEGEGFDIDTNNINLLGLISDTKIETIKTEAEFLSELKYGQNTPN